MRNLLLLFIAFLFFQFSLLAQAPDTSWTRKFGGGMGRSVQQTSDGGYIITGSTKFLSAGDNDLWLIKTDSLGNILWTKTYGGSESDVGYSIQQTTDGGYIITGITQSFGAGENDIWLIKTNNSGDTLWTKTIGGSNNDVGNSVQQTNDGGYIIAGSMYSSVNNGYDVWLIKTDSLGDTLWTKTYGGGEFDFGYSTQQTEDGGYIITGNTYSYGFGDLNVWLIKTNDSGDTLWTKWYGGLSVDGGFSVRQTTDGGYIIAGYTYLSSAGGGDVYLIKTDAFGDTLWTKTLGGSYPEMETGFSVQQTTDGGYIITGDVQYPSWQSALLLIKTNAIGDTLWTKKVGEMSNGNTGYDVKQTIDGGYIVTGETNYYINLFYTDLYLVKIGSDATSAVPVTTTYPFDFSLQQNFPNPFNSSTKIKYLVPKSSNLVIKVLDILGKEIETLVNEEKPPGTYEITWYADNLPSGVYFYQLRVGSFIETKKMVLLK